MILPVSAPARVHTLPASCQWCAIPERMFKSTLPPVVAAQQPDGTSLVLLCCTTVRGAADAVLSEPGGFICGVAVQSRCSPSSHVAKQQHRRAHGQAGPNLSLMTVLFCFVSKRLLLPSLSDMQGNLMLPGCIILHYLHSCKAKEPNASQ